MVPIKSWPWQWELPLFDNGHYDFYDLIEEERSSTLPLWKTNVRKINFVWRNYVCIYQCSEREMDKEIFEESYTHGKLFNSFNTKKIMFNLIRYIWYCSCNIGNICEKSARFHHLSQKIWFEMNYARKRREQRKKTSKLCNWSTNFHIAWWWCVLFCSPQWP